MTQPATPDDSPATRWGVIALAAVAVLTLLGGVAALVIGHLGGASSAAPSAAPAAHSPRYIACIQMDDDQDYCGRFARDIARRTELTQQQRDRLDAQARRADRAVHEPSFCADLLRQAPSGRYAQCEGLPATADAEAIRLSLDEAGFPGATVRAARADDPAPRGSIVFGVPIADACFVGYESPPRGGGSYSLQGRLPDDRCLSA
jgi:hypothetical protein